MVDLITFFFELPLQQQQNQRHNNNVMKNFCFETEAERIYKRVEAERIYKLISIYDLMQKLSTTVQLNTQLRCCEFRPFSKNWE